MFVSFVCQKNNLAVLIQILWIKEIFYQYNSCICQVMASDNDSLQDEGVSVTLGKVFSNIQAE